jgi:hypothetical protein
VRYGAAVVLVGWAIYSYFIRPRLGTTVLAPYWYADSQIPITNHENLMRLGWYLSPLGVGLAVAGGVLMLLNERWDTSWPLWVVGGASTAIYIFNIFNNPVHIYAMRRYVPIVLPFFTLAGAYAISWLWQRAPWQRASRPVSLALLVALAGWLTYNDRLIVNQVDYEGALTQVERVAALLEDGAVVLFVDDPAVGLGAILGTPLQFLHGASSFDLQEDQVEADLLKGQVAHWLGEGTPVYVIRNADSSILLLNECLVPAGSAHLDTPRLEQTYDHIPQVIEHVRYDLEVYRVGPGCTGAR